VLCLLSLAGVIPQALAQQDKQTLVDLGEFTAEKSPWASRGGSNISLTVTSNAPYPDDKTHVLKLSLEKKGTDERNSQNWFFIERDFTPNESWSKALGIGLTLALNQERNWWLCLNVWTTDGKQYDYFPITPGNFTTQFEDRWIDFGKFKPNDKENKTPLEPAKINKIRLSGSGNAGEIYLKSLVLYQAVTSAQWLDVKTQSQYGMSIFQRDEPVALSFEMAGNVPQKVSGFKYEISDFDQQVIATGAITITTDQSTYAVNPKIHLPGYYEVRAYAQSSDGKLDDLSCVRALGSTPGTFATFAVLPTTVHENITHMLKEGVNSFFGIHGTRRYLNLNELLGMPWILIYTRWNHLEHTRPDRKTADASATWSIDKIRKETPIPAYLIPHTSLSSAMDRGTIPPWAQNDDPKGLPAYKNWHDYELMARDYIRFNKRLAPHVKHRTYGVLWEPELNTPQYRVNSHTPLYTDTSQMVDLIKREGQIIKKHDPDALILGPTAMWCYGFEFWESFLKNGLLDHVDAVSSHFYVAPPPESADIPGKLKTLRNLFAQYGKKDVPIYNTEAGFRSQVGTKHLIREHAGWVARYAMILKGEGVKMHLQFFPHDIIEDWMGQVWSTYGLCFIHQDLKQFDFNVEPNQLTPKPVVTALANLTNQIHGMDVVRHLRDWGLDVWGYVFARDNQPVIAIWQPFKSQQCRIVVGDVNSVTVIDMQGREQNLAVTEGCIDLLIDEYPRYIRGASPEIYMASDMQKQDPVINATPLIYPGQQATINVRQVLGDNTCTVLSVTSWGSCVASVKDDAHVSITSPLGSPAMACPVQIKLRMADGSTQTRQQWVRVGNEVSVERMELASENQKLGVRLHLENHTSNESKINVALITNRDSKWATRDLTLKASDKSAYFIPLQTTIATADAATQSLDIRLKITGKHGLDIQDQHQVFFLSAYPASATQNVDTLFPDHLTLTGKGSSGKTDSADIKFAWDSQYLHLHLVSHDDQFTQSHSNDKIWSQDSIQIAFDTDPQSLYPYNPAAGIYNKKITEITVAQTPTGPLVWRHMTYNESQLATGKVAEGAMDINIQRDDPSGITTYDLKIPWQQIGLDSIQQGKNLGIALVVNDVDGQGKRLALELFKGIFNNKNAREYGRIVLR
jgi:hypothetical protein